MSVKIMTAVWSTQVGNHTDKLVLLALADNANDEGMCYPSITTLATKCEMDRSTILRAIARLESDSHLSRQQRSGRSTIYRIHPSQAATSGATQPVAESDPTRRATPPPVVALCDPTRRAVRPITIIEPSIEPSREPKTARSRSPTLAEGVFEHWQREWNHPGAKLDPKRRKRIEARLKDFSPEQLCRAISGFKHSPWHTGTDPKSQGTVYDSIECLLRDSSQVEKGLRFFESPPRAPEALSPIERVRQALAANRNTPDERVVSEQSGSGMGTAIGLLRRIPGT